jgi:hypothetical protein
MISNLENITYIIIMHISHIMDKFDKWRLEIYLHSRLKGYSLYL